MPGYKIADLSFLAILALMLVAEIFTSVPWWSYAILVSCYGAVNAWGAANLNSGFFVRTHWKGDPNSKMIALTFDDGPIAGQTDKILTTLRQYDVPAAFFCIGNRIRGNEQLLKRIDNEGHMIGNHSFFHGKTFDLMSAQSVRQELINTNKKIGETIGKEPAFFRPPYGVTNPMIAAAVEKEQYKIAGWSVRSFDTITKDPARLLNRTTSQLKGGDVVLFHDFCETTHEILPRFIEFAREKGLIFVRLDQLLNENAYR